MVCYSNFLRAIFLELKKNTKNISPLSFLKHFVSNFQDIFFNITKNLQEADFEKKKSNKKSMRKIKKKLTYFDNFL